MVKEVTPREWGELLEVWESAVRATHDFISEEDLQFYKKAIPERYLPELCVYCLRNEAGRMLFRRIGLRDRDAVRPRRSAGTGRGP